MKKLISLMLALMLVFSLATVAMANEGGNPDAEEVVPKADQNASFTKTYKITNTGTTNPQETFTFKFTADHLTDSNANLNKNNMPSIPDATVTFDAGTATATGLAKTVDVALSNITWPGVGVYYYTVNEEAKTTAGVTYDGATAYLKVTVAYDSGTDTYYTAFVTLNLADKDQNGITDSKTGGFTNEYSAGSLAVTKNVTGNLGDQTKPFTVTVTFTAPEGKTVRESISYTDDGVGKTIATTDWENGVASVEITLKHEETVTFTNIPYGVTYTVEEDDYTAEADGGYDEAEYDFSDDTKKIDTASDTVTITNNKSVDVDTGITLDSLPFVLILAVCAGAVVLFVIKRRNSVEF